jgi:hypothetical protein
MLIDQRPGKPPDDSGVPLEARRNAVRSVLNSAALEKSARLRDLLVYLADRSAENPDASVPEQEVGVAVFGRKDYDPSQDNLVRVQATHLRKKLQHYFSTEGANDPVVFEIPRGSYGLVFRQRDASPPEKPARRLNRAWLLLIPASAVLFFAGWLAHDLAAQRRSARPPTVDKLWTQFFAGQPVNVVLSDAILTVIDDLGKRTLGLHQFGRPIVIQDLMAERITDPEVRKAIVRMAGKQFITFADVTAARKIQFSGIGDRNAMNYMFARSFDVERLKQDHTVLLGNRRANPWVELFDRQLRLRYRFDDEKLASWFEDTQAGPADQRIYPTVWDRESHCQIAILPNLRQNGNVLVIAGGDFPAVQAGAEFLTSEDSVRELARRLNVAERQRFPYFEALLKTESLSNASPSYRIVFSRAIQ